jgi:membrane fusion protein, copper/silver efflux system
MKDMKPHIRLFTRLGLLVISASVIDLSACKNSSEKTEAVKVVPKEVWTCSMHPEIIREHPGNCPICGMVLVRKVDQAKAVSGIRLEELIRPADRFVVSSIPLTSVAVKEIQPTIEAYGTVNYDTRQISTISARVSGRIEKIYVHYRYQHVMKGERIMDIYSPELQTAQQELLFLTSNDPDNISLIGAARQRLLLLGMNDNEIQQVMRTKKPVSSVAVYSNYSGHLHEAGNSMPVTEPGAGQMNATLTEELPVKEGMYIQKGQVIFQIFNTDKSWILLNIFPGSQKMVQPGNLVNIIPETAPKKAFSASIDFIEPFFREKEKTFIARIYFDNSQLQLPIGSQVKATIAGKTLKSGWLPEEAVLSLGLQHIVFIKTEGGFKAHVVKTGMVYQHQIEVLSGLNQADSVAGNAQYLADSEGFIKTNTAP